jgi:hypothetical protein
LIIDGAMPKPHDAPASTHRRLRIYHREPEAEVAEARMFGARPDPE